MQCNAGIAAFFEETGNEHDQQIETDGGIGRRGGCPGYPVADRAGARAGEAGSQCTWEGSHQGRFIGGMGSILGSFFGAFFITILPLVLTQMPGLLGVPLSTETTSHMEAMIFGALIVFFLIAEPHGLARLWAIGKEKLRLWPFPH